jgi:hypothetical protein
MFEYGTTTDYGSTSPPAPAGSGSTPTTVTADLAGLSPGTTYHYRLVASHGARTFPGGDAVFTTSPEAGATPTAPPIVTKPNPIAVMRATARVSCKRSGRRLRCVFRATGARRVTGTVSRGGRRVGRFSGRVGRRLTIKVRGLRKGRRYTLRVTFIDAAGRRALVKKTVKA